MTDPAPSTSPMTDIERLAERLHAARAGQHFIRNTADRAWQKWMINLVDVAQEAATALTDLVRERDLEHKANVKLNALIEDHRREWTNEAVALRSDLLATQAVVEAARALTFLDDGLNQHRCKIYCDQWSGRTDWRPCVGEKFRAALARLDERPATREEQP